jgi:ubiquinone/menaquinone biosynthesis C-methylase UbiE
VTNNSRRIWRDTRFKTRWDPKVDNKPIIGPHNRFIQRFMSSYLRIDQHILDVGCGVGNCLHLIDRKGCFGIDVEINALKTAKKYCINSRFLVASCLNLPFRDETFDLAVMFEVIEHLRAGTEKQAIAEIQRILKGSGLLLLSTPNRHFISNILDPSLFFGHRHYNVKKLVKLITEIGFSVKEYIHRGGLSAMIGIYIFYFNKHVLHKYGGNVQRFFDQYSDKEFNSKKEGISHIFIAAEKS